MAETKTVLLLLNFFEDNTAVTETIIPPIRIPQAIFPVFFIFAIFLPKDASIYIISSFEYKASTSSSSFMQTLIVSLFILIKTSI